MDNDRESYLKHIQGVRDAAIGWIGSADTKATALLSIQGVVLGIVAAAALAIDGKVSNIQFAVLLMFLLSTLVSVVAAGWALIPRTDRKEILREAEVHNPLAVSPSYFADLAALPAPKFETLMNSDEALFEQDRLEQALILCRIAASKMMCVRVSGATLLLSLFLLLIFVFTRIKP